MRARQRQGVMVLLQGRQSRGGLAGAHLLLFPLCYRSHGLACSAALVAGVAEHGANVVHKERIQQLGNLLLVGKVERPLVRDPAAIKVSRVRRGGENAPTYQTPLRCMGPILTTWRTFSLLRMPSRRPRVMPATFSSLVPLIM